MRNLRVLLATIAAGGALLGSITGLLDIATRTRMPTLDLACGPGPNPGCATLPTGAAALVLGLDIVAIVSALLLWERPGDRRALGTLLLAAGVSTGLQVIGAPEDLLSRVAHGSPPFMAVWAFELVRPAPAKRSRTQSTRNVARATPAPAKAGPTAGVPPAAGGSAPPAPAIPAGGWQEGGGGSAASLPLPGDSSKAEAGMPFGTLVFEVDAWHGGTRRTMRSVERAVREITGTCGKRLAKQVYDALPVEAP